MASKEVEVVPEADDVIDEPGGGSPIWQVQRFITGAVGDVRSIARAVSVLPEIAVHLSAIRVRVENLDDEVAAMRRSVDGIRTEVDGMREAVNPLDERLRDVTERFDRMLPELEGLSLAAHPVRRARLRFRSSPRETE